MGLEREMAGIEEMDLPVGKIALVGLRPGRNEGWIMPAPHGEKRRLMLAEIRLELRVAGDIAGVIPDQVQWISSAPGRAIKAMSSMYPSGPSSRGSAPVRYCQFSMTSAESDALQASRFSGVSSRQ